MDGKRVALTWGVHQALAEFQWFVEYLGRRPTRLYELMPLHPTLDGYQDAYGYMCGGAVILGPTALTRTPQQQPSAAATSLDPKGAQSIKWRALFPADITTQLVSWGNPEDQVTNSDLELVGSVIHHACMANCFDISDRVTLSQTDNTAGLWW